MAYAIIEVEICHSMLSVSWRTRKASRIIQPQSEGPRTRSSNADRGQEEEMGIPGQEEGESIALSLLFVCLGPQ